MNETQQQLVSELNIEGKRYGRKHQTLTDTVLLSAWVVGYAGVLIVFRVAGAMERLMSSKQMEVPDVGKVSASEGRN
jgi:hypothetical protein